MPNIITVTSGEIFAKYCRSILFKKNDVFSFLEKNTSAMAWQRK